MVHDFSDAEAPVSPILGFFRNEESRKLIASAFDRSGLGELILNEGGLDVALKVMRRGDKPSLILYDVSGSITPIADIETLVKHGGRALPVIAVGDSIDTARFREFLAAGVFDYLDRALGSIPLTDAVARARRQRARRTTESGPLRNGKVIVFCGSRGGVGTTSCAIATAWTLAHDGGNNTALLDLDLTLGTTAFALDIDPGHGLRQGLEQPARIDAVFIERCLVRESPRLAILSAEEPFDNNGEVEPAAATVLLDELKQTFDCIVVDLPRGVSSLNRAVLAAADDIVLVTAATLTGLRDTIRWTEYISLVANRAVVRIVQGPAPGGAALPRGDFEKSLGRKIDIIMPFDAKSMIAAANGGKALSAEAPHSAATRAVSELAELLGYSAPVIETKRATNRWPWKARNVLP
jgi:pilus assembly protein CpaE